MSIPLVSSCSDVNQLMFENKPTKNENVQTKIVNISDKVKAWTAKIHDSYPKAESDDKREGRGGMIAGAVILTAIVIVTCAALLLGALLPLGVLPAAISTSAFFAAYLSTGLSGFAIITLATSCFPQTSTFNDTNVRRRAELADLLQDLPNLENLCPIEASVQDLLKMRRSQLEEQRIIRELEQLRKSRPALKTASID